MALFSMDTGSLDDLNKISSYLYRLNQNIEYMFSHLTPEDNYSDTAYNKYVSDGERTTALEMSVDGIKLTMVTKDGVVAAINLSQEGVKIQGTKIALEGVVTANNYFKINLDGSMEATNGSFTGTVSASTLSGNALSGGTINIQRGNNIGLYCNGNVFRFGDFEVNDRYGRQVLQSSDACSGLCGEPDDPDNDLYMWAAYYSSHNYVFVVNGSDAYVRHGGTGTAYPIAQTLKSLSDRISALGG